MDKTLNLSLTPVLLGTLRLPAQHPNLAVLSAFIRSVADRLRLNEETRFDLEVAVEEAATNIITHAYKSDAVGELEVQLRLLAEDEIQISLLDWGIPFPMAQIKPFDLHAPVETRIHGGMGLHIIQSVMDHVERHISQQPDDPNQLRLTKHLRRVGGKVAVRRERRELAALQTISQVMTANIELDELLHIIIQTLVRTIEAERGTLYLIDEERGECWSKVILEDKEVLPEIRIKIGEGIAGKVAETGKPLNIRDAYHHPLFNSNFDRQTGYQTRNILAVPMRNPQQKVIGVVQLLNKIGGDFTLPDERLLTAMASQAAISIENARLYKQELQQKLLERELQTAHDIQTSFLPEAIPQPKGWEISTYWKPIAEVAGDFYDFREMDNGRLALIIADVSGKGMPAALFMALTVIVLRFGMSLNLSPLDLILRTNRGIIQHQHSKMFATIFIGYLDTATGDLEFISAGHNPPLHYHAGTGECDILRAKGAAVGVFMQAVYEPKHTQLSVGDCLLLYTDGMTEILNEDEDEFGEERLVAVLQETAHLTADEIRERILQVVHDFAGALGSVDDETLIVIKRIA